LQSPPAEDRGMPSALWAALGIVVLGAAAYLVARKR
jgi:hypothetical protein